MCFGKAVQIMQFTKNQQQRWIKKT